jgi:DNA-binding MarR family transcriptional regulator
MKTMKSNVKSPDAIHGLLFMAAKRAHQGVERWFLTQKIGITPLQFGVLRVITKEDKTLNELARCMTFKPPSILPSIDFLENHGCITRRSDPKDRRKIHLAATAKGKRIVLRVTSSRKPDPLGAAFRKMTTAKKKQLVALLGELNQKILKSD